MRLTTPEATRCTASAAGSRPTSCSRMRGADAGASKGLGVVWRAAHSELTPRTWTLNAFRSATPTTGGWRLSANLSNEMLSLSPSISQWPSDAPHGPSNLLATPAYADSCCERRQKTPPQRSYRHGRQREGRSRRPEPPSNLFEIRFYFRSVLHYGRMIQVLGKIAQQHILPRLQNANERGVGVWSARRSARCATASVVTW